MSPKLVWINDGPEATRKARIAVLQQEIEFTHYANKLYWREANPSHALRADYYRRQDRLEEISERTCRTAKA